MALQAASIAKGFCGRGLSAYIINLCMKQRVNVSKITWKGLRTSAPCTTTTMRTRGGVKLSFDLVGSQGAPVTGEKSPIIFLHGATSARESWNNVIHPIAVATGRKAYAYDARNHGDSGWSSDFTYEILQDDLLEFMDCLHMKQAILVGHSMGGRTAMFFATREPERVEKLIIEDASPAPYESHIRYGAQKYLELLRYVIKKIPPEITDLQKAKNFVNEILQKTIPEAKRSSRHGTTDGSTLPLTQDENGKFVWKTNLKAVEDNFLESLSATNPGSYPGPTLILYGTKSLYKVSNDREYISRMFPGSELRAVEGAGHELHLEYEDIFVKEVAEFINEPDE